MNLEMMKKNLRHVHPEWSKETIDGWAMPNSNGKIAIIAIHKSEMAKWGKLTAEEQKALLIQRAKRQAGRISQSCQLRLF